MADIIDIRSFSRKMGNEVEKNLTGDNLLSALPSDQKGKIIDLGQRVAKKVEKEVDERIKKQSIPETAEEAVEDSLNDIDSFGDGSAEEIGEEAEERSEEELVDETAGVGDEAKQQASQAASGQTPGGAPTTSDSSGQNQLGDQESEDNPDYGGEPEEWENWDVPTRKPTGPSSLLGKKGWERAAEHLDDEEEPEEEPDALDRADEWIDKQNPSGFGNKEWQKTADNLDKDKNKEGEEKKPEQKQAPDEEPEQQEDAQKSDSPTTQQNQPQPSKKPSSVPGNAGYGGVQQSTTANQSQRKTGGDKPKKQKGAATQGINRMRHGLRNLEKQIKKLQKLKQRMTRALGSVNTMLKILKLKKILLTATIAVAKIARIIVKAVGFALKAVGRPLIAAFGLGLILFIPGFFLDPIVTFIIKLVIIPLNALKKLVEKSIKSLEKQKKKLKERLERVNDILSEKEEQLQRQLNQSLLSRGDKGEGKLKHGYQKTNLAQRPKQTMSSRGQLPGSGGRQAGNSQSVAGRRPPVQASQPTGSAGGAGAGGGPIGITVAAQKAQEEQEKR
ncbi:MAG: hypothetical protein ABII02_01590 [Candidatus Magasanikbacteria bacterium]